MNKESRAKSLAIIEERRKKMQDDNSTSLALQKKIGKDLILFGVEREDDGYRVAVYYVVDNVIVDRKTGASQLKHHAIAIMESYISQYAIDFYEQPKKYFESLVIS